MTVHSTTLPSTPLNDDQLHYTTLNHITQTTLHHLPLQYNRLQTTPQVQLDRTLRTTLHEITLQYPSSHNSFNVKVHYSPLQPHDHTPLHPTRLH